MLYGRKSVCAEKEAKPGGGEVYSIGRQRNFMNCWNGFIKFYVAERIITFSSLLVLHRSTFCPSRPQKARNREHEGNFSSPLAGGIFLIKGNVCRINFGERKTSDKNLNNWDFNRRRRYDFLSPGLIRHLPQAEIGFSVGRRAPECRRNEQIQLRKLEN
jgi:hypothetical protein